MLGGIGLTRIPTEELEGLLKLVHRGTLRYPLRRSDLLMQPLQRLAEHGHLLFGLDEAAVRAVLVAVLAERRASATRTP